MWYFRGFVASIGFFGGIACYFEKENDEQRILGPILFTVFMAWGWPVTVPGMLGFILTSVVSRVDKDNNNTGG